MLRAHFDKKRKKHARKHAEVFARHAAEHYGETGLREPLLKKDAANDDDDDGSGEVHASKGSTLSSVAGATMVFALTAAGREHPSSSFNLVVSFKI